MKTLKDVFTKYPHIVEVMQNTAIMAGYEILDEYDNVEVGVELKKDDSPLTVADRRAHMLIYDSLCTQFPDIDVVSEEGECELSDGKAGIFFLVDPLDGTKEFLKQTGEFTVNIALVCAGRAELGVVYVPVEKSLYSTTRDGRAIVRRSATLEDEFGVEEEIWCRSVPTSGPTVVMSASHSSQETVDYAALYNPAETVSAGSSLKFCRVAEGHADIYPRLGRTMEWDTAAAHAILKAAGGNVVTIRNAEELKYGKPGLDNSYFIAVGSHHKLIKSELDWQ